MDDDHAPSEPTAPVPQLQHSSPRSKSEVSLQDQTSRMSTKKLFVIFTGIGLSLFLSFLDSTSVATALPTIAQELKAGQSISWVGTSYLVANTSCQLIYGRLSDIFGRKNLLIFALGLFALGDLLCGFAQSPAQLYVFRAIAGLGGGGINNMAMIIMSDVTSLKERAKWQGYIATAVAIGSALGPFLGALFAQKVTWRWTFWCTVPVSAFCSLMIFMFVPLVHVHGDFSSKLAKVDFLGSLLSLGANVCILIPISAGGATYEWNSPLVIALLIVGVLFSVAFVIVEWKVAALPNLPLRLFRYQTVAVIIVQTWFVGAVYYGNLYFLPIYFQSLRSMSAITSAVFLLPLLVPQTLSSITNGQITMRTGGIKPQIVVGFTLWFIGAGLETTFGETTAKSKLVGFLILQGIGVGGTLQTTLVAAQAGAPPIDRAVVTGARNFSRTFGGAFGLAISNAILNNVVSSRLPSTISPSLRKQITHSASLSGLPPDLDQATLQGVRDAFARALYIVWIVYLALVGICWVMSWFIQEHGLPDNARIAAEAAAQGEVPEKLAAADSASETPIHEQV